MLLIKKICLKQEYIESLKVKEWEKGAKKRCTSFSYINIKQNRFKGKSIARDKKGHFKMLNNSIKQEDMLILNLHTQ